MGLTRAVKLIAIAAMSAGLCACNMVMTTEPMFKAADAAGAPGLKEGVWVNMDADCKADLAGPVDGWPECASGVVLKDGAFRGEDKDGKTYAIPVVLAAGDPRILQVQIQDDAPSMAGESPGSIFLYVALEAVKSDAAGNIVEYRGWSVLCGPPPPEGSKQPNGKPRYGTLKPLPGLTLDAEQSGCTPADKAALIGAAKASRAFAPEAEGVSRWLRAKGP